VCSKYFRKNKKAKVGKREVKVPAAPQPVVRPTDRASIIRTRDSELEVDQLRWGLISSWAKDPKIGLQCINARSETVAEKPAFRDLLARRRCLIPADSFYEWETRDRRKIPWRFERPDHEPFCMAGLWDRWNSPEGPLETFTILTCPPNLTRRLRAQSHARSAFTQPGRSLASRRRIVPPSPRPRRFPPQIPRRTRTTERLLVQL
jgi:putative SOS response-associated peptidase YedK